MKTISFKFKADKKLREVISEDSRICSAMRRFAFNRFMENLSQKEIYKQLTEKFEINSYLALCALRSAQWLVKAVGVDNDPTDELGKIFNKPKKVYFGKFKRFQRGLISKEEYKDSRNTGIITEGEVRFKGNRFFKIDTENAKIIYKRKCKEHYDLNLVEKLTEKRKKILSTIQLLMEEKKIPISIVIKNDMIYLSYDETIVEKEKKFKNLFQNRVLGLDLNPNYIGVSIIEFNKQDKYKILYKEAIDLSELQSQSTNKIKFELYEINHHILRLCKKWHCSKIAIEDLKFDKKKKFWSKDLNRLCKNNFRFNILKMHLNTLCNTYGVEFIEVNSAYSSIIGNFRHGSSRCPDMVAAATEIARRSYHKYQKGWFQPSFVKKQRLQQVLGNQWKKALGLGCRSWKGLAEKAKELKLRYRFPLDSSNAVFRKNYVKKHWILYAFE